MNRWKMRIIPCNDRLLQAAYDMRFLLERGYTRRVSLSIVSDRYRLKAEERRTLYRGVYPEEVVKHHRSKRVDASTLRDKRVGVDLYNVLITLEGGLSGEILVMADDGFLRDIRGIHGKYHRRPSTPKALEMVVGSLLELRVGEAHFYLDSNISRSGDMRVQVEGLMRGQGLRGDASTTKAPDRYVSAQEVAMSSDAIIIERSPAAFDLPAHILSQIEDIKAIILKPKDPED
jgi:hypothetical protein